MGASLGGFTDEYWLPINPDGGWGNIRRLGRFGGFKVKMDFPRAAGMTGFSVRVEAESKALGFPTCARNDGAE